MKLFNRQPNKTGQEFCTNANDHWRLIIISTKALEYFSKTKFSVALKNYKFRNVFVFSGLDVEAEIETAYVFGWEQQCVPKETKHVHR